VYATRPAWIDISGWSDEKLINETKLMGDPSCDIHQLLNRYEQLS
jgi:hypothetical protein